MRGQFRLIKWGLFVRKLQIKRKVDRVEYYWNLSLQIEKGLVSLFIYQHYALQGIFSGNIRRLF